MNKKKPTQTPVTPSSQTEHALPTPKRTYKDTLFRMIFREKNNLLPLYNALNGMHYMYQKPETNPELELSVRILNINSGHHKELLAQCQILAEYMQYINTVRHYAEQMPIAEAVELAVTECIRKGILTDFLSKYRKEAVSVSIFEYDEEQTIRLIRQDEYRQGILQSLCNLMHTLKLNASQAMDALDIPEEERAFYTAQIQKK